MGLQPDVCARQCAATRASPYAGYFGARPWIVLGLRPTMQLAGRSEPAYHGTPAGRTLPK